MRKVRPAFTPYLVIFATAFLSTSCGPQVQAFDVMPRALCPGQQARVTWRIRGTPTLLVRVADPRLGSFNDPADPSMSLVPDTLEFTIVAVKGGKEAVQHLDIQQYADAAGTEVVFPSTLVGDTIVAAGNKNPVRWAGQFVVRTLASASGRPLEVRHAGVIVQLNAAGTPTLAPAGTTVSGWWEIRSLLSQAERTDPASRPDRLRVNLVIACQRSQP